MISIVTLLAAIALPALKQALTKSQIIATVSNYQQLYILTQNASIDNVNAGGGGVFPGDLSNSIDNWSNALVPTYCSSNTFLSLGKINGLLSNSVIWYAQFANEPSTIFISTFGIGGSSSNLTFNINGPYGTIGGAVVTVSGQAISIIGTNSLTLSNGSLFICPNGSASF